MTKWIGIAVVLAVVVIAVFLLTQNPPQEAPRTAAQARIRVVLAEAMQPVCAPVYVAAEKGFFKEQGLDVQLVPFSKGKLCLDAVVGGKADVATVAETPLMHLGFTKVPVAILSTIHFATRNTKCVVRRDKGIEKPADLKGHKVGVPIGGNAEYLMDKFLQKYGLTRNDVTVVNLNPPEMVGAIDRGDIDASFSWEPHIHRTLTQLGDKAQVFEAEDLYRETFDIAAMKDWADKNSETCKRLLRALVQANAYIRSNKDESVAIVARRIQMEPKELAAIWSYYHFTVALDQSLLESLKEQAKWALGIGTQKGAVPDYRYMFYPAPLKAINPSAVTVNLQ
jgi:ABC-type nitrate/sulfonate/bicarbonate transport system substrate-binding protein